MTRTFANAGRAGNNMSGRRGLLFLVCMALTSQHANGTDLALTIRAHARSVTFGDPIYVEIRIVNKGTETVQGLPRHSGLERLHYTILNPEPGLQTTGYSERGGTAPRILEAGKTATLYDCFFLPYLNALDRPFWKSIQQGQKIYIRGRFLLNRGVFVESDWLAINVLPRREEEMEVLKEWRNAEITASRASSKGPQPGDLGLKHARPLGRNQVLQMASQIDRAGEIADLLDLTAQLQSLYTLPEAERDLKNQSLVDWLKKQPKIKRTALSITLKPLAQSYNMTTTAKAVATLLD